MLYVQTVGRTDRVESVVGLLFFWSGWVVEQSVDVCTYREIILHDCVVFNEGMHVCLLHKDPKKHGFKIGNHCFDPGTKQTNKRLPR